MLILWNRCAGVLMTAYLASAVCASAAFSGHFAVPGGPVWLADSAGSTVAIGNWVLDGSSNNVAQLVRSGGVDATGVTLAADVAAWADFRIANTTATPFAISFGWSGELGYVGDQFAYYLNGVPTVLATGTGSPALYSNGLLPVSLVLPVGGTFGWRVTSDPVGASPTSSAFTLLTPVAIPEPSAALLAVLGLTGSTLLRRRRN